MIYEFKQVPISELGKIVTGKTPSSKLDGMYGDEILFVTPKDFNGVKYISRTERFLSHEGKEKLKNFVIPSGSIVVSCIGSDMGKAAIVTRESITNQQLNSIIVNNGDNPEYVYYLLSTMKHYLKNLASGGSTMPLLNKTSFSKINLNIPIDRVIQDKSVTLLNSIDKKIEVNEKINFTLEQIAQTLFKSWFVDFDPVHAKKLALKKGLTPAQAERAAMAIIAGVCCPVEFAENFEEMNGKLSEKLSKMSKEKQEELAHTASLFPSEFEDGEARQIPKEWTFKEIQEVFEVRDGTHDSPKKSLTGFHLVTSRHIVGGELDLSKAYKISEEDYDFVNKRSKVDVGDILITMIGTVGETLLIQNEPQFAIKNIGLFKSSQNKKIMFFVDQYLKTRKMKSYMDARLAGTTQKYLSLTELRKLPLLVINEDLLKIFNTFIEPIYSQININNETNKTLEKLRDTLLPELLSGNIDLTKIEIGDDL